MKRNSYFILALIGFTLLPTLVHAQVSAGVSSMHTVLDNVYNQMIPMCANLIAVCQAVAGLGTIFYIGVRVWKHIARAEPIDFFPLFRPFVMVLLIGMFPQVLGVINGILSPTVTYTAQMVQNSNVAVQTLLVIRTAQITSGDTTSVMMTLPQQGGQQNWDKYTQPSSTNSGGGGGFWSAIGDGFKFVAGGIASSLRLMFQMFLSTWLEILYYAASLCIDTIRVFHLIILAILGPFAFAFSCYDGFQNSLTHWLGRYINIYLWLPIANLLGAILGQIQQNMLQIDLASAQSGVSGQFAATDIAYLIFLLMGIIGYTTVPGIANYIVHTHGPNPIAQKVNALAGMAVNAAVGGATGGAGGAAAGGAGGAGGGAAAGASSSGASDPNQFAHDKIAG